MVNNRNCAGGNLPSTNIAESDAGYTVKMALPGIGKENIKISVDKNVLSVNVTIPDNGEDSSAYTYREFDVRDASRNFTLGDKVDTEKINAEFNNGILTITLKKKDEFIPKPARVIEVE
jgi:HSP20 family protein